METEPGDAEDKVGCLECEYKLLEGVFNLYRKRSQYGAMVSHMPIAASPLFVFI